jgi:hypothetical protein
MIDEGECDWKVVVIDADDKWAPFMNNISDVEEQLSGMLSAIREWYCTYKIPNGKPPNMFGLQEHFLCALGSPGGIPRWPCPRLNNSFPPGRFCASSFTFLLDPCDTRTNVDKKTNRDVAAFPGKPIQLVSCFY